MQDEQKVTITIEQARVALRALHYQSAIYADRMREIQKTIDTSENTAYWERMIGVYRTDRDRALEVYNFLVRAVVEGQDND